MIEIEDLWKSYEGNQVLKGLSLKVETGESLVILGRSGVGKSVLLKHIIGIAQSDRGHIEVDGVRVSALKGEKRYSATRHMGMLFQGAALFDSMNIEENTAFYLKQHGDFEGGKKYSKSEIQDRVDEALRMVDLEGTQKKMPSDLSGGMRKRAGLARLIVYRPKYLLYDEPTTGLDIMTTQTVIQFIKGLKAQGTPVIFSTHHLDEVALLCDRVAVINEGISCFDGTVDEFKQAGNSDELNQAFMNILTEKHDV